MNEQVSFTLRGRNPDVLTCIANLSNDEVFSQSLASAILHPTTGGESVVVMIEQKISRPLGVKLAETENQYPAGTESLHGFAPQLTWSHYHALMRVEGSP